MVPAWLENHNNLQTGQCGPKNSLQEVQISHTAPLLGTQKVEYVQLQIPDKQDEKT
jgi:hypothetical protein